MPITKLQIFVFLYIKCSIDYLSRLSQTTDLSHINLIFHDKLNFQEQELTYIKQVFCYLYRLEPCKCHHSSFVIRTGLSRKSFVSRKPMN